MSDTTNSFLKAQTEVLTAKTKYSMQAQINYRWSNFCQAVNMYSKNKQIPLGVIWWTCRILQRLRRNFPSLKLSFPDIFKRQKSIRLETEEVFRRKYNWSCGLAVKGYSHSGQVDTEDEWRQITDLLVIYLLDPPNIATKYCKQQLAPWTRD